MLVRLVVLVGVVVVVVMRVVVVVVPGAGAEPAHGEQQQVAAHRGEQDPRHHLGDRDDELRGRQGAEGEHSPDSRTLAVWVKVTTSPRSSRAYDALARPSTVPGDDSSSCWTATTASS